MECPQCSRPGTEVIESYSHGSGIRRRRECPDCHERFVTIEQVQRALIMVVKKDGRREEFQREKLLQALRICARKRPLATGAIAAIADEVEQRLVASGRDEVASRVIGEMVISHLRRLDPIAYIRFASVYHQFISLEDMLTELQSLAQTPVPPPEQPRLFADDLDRMVAGESDLPRAPTPIESARAASPV